MVIDNLWKYTAENTVSSMRLEGNTTSDIAIIGGGFTGCSAAFHAANLGADVCLLSPQSVNATHWLNLSATNRTAGGALIFADLKMVSVSAR